MKRFVIAHALTGIAYGLVLTGLAWILLGAGDAVSSFAFGASVCGLVYALDIPLAISKQPRSFGRIIAGTVIVTVFASGAAWPFVHSYPSLTYGSADVTWGWSMIGAASTALVLSLCIRIFRSTGSAGKAAG